MVKRGFDQTATKEDLKPFATKDDLKDLATKAELARVEQKVDDGFRAVNSRLDLIREDIADLPHIREEPQDLRQRLVLVEKKVGLTK